VSDDVSRPLKIPGTLQDASLPPIELMKAVLRERAITFATTSLLVWGVIKLRSSQLPGNWLRLRSWATRLALCDPP
jgi:hypothetical protein